MVMLHQNVDALLPFNTELLKSNITRLMNQHLFSSCSTTVILDYSS